MKRSDLIREISRGARRAGLLWVMVREGGNHSIFTLGEQRIPIPAIRFLNTAALSEDRVEFMTRDAISLMLEVEPSGFDLEFEFI